MGHNIDWKFVDYFCFQIELFCLDILNVEGSDGGSYIDRVIFCVVFIFCLISRIVLVGDETSTEVLSNEVIF